LLLISPGARLSLSPFLFTGVFLQGKQTGMLPEAYPAKSCESSSFSDEVDAFQKDLHKKKLTNHLGIDELVAKERNRDTRDGCEL